MDSFWRCLSSTAMNASLQSSPLRREFTSCIEAVMRDREHTIWNRPPVHCSHIGKSRSCHTVSFLTPNWFSPTTFLCFWSHFLLLKKTSKWFSPFLVVFTKCPQINFYLKKINVNLKMLFKIRECWLFRHFSKRSFRYHWGMTASLRSL